MDVMELVDRITGKVGGGGRALENETQSNRWKCWRERCRYRLLWIFGAGRSGLRDT
jgi:hypothetical protein